MATAVTMNANASTDSYNAETEIYISTATLQLKVKGDYVWHTEVLTPPETPTPTAQETEVAKTNVSESKAGAATAISAAAVGAAAALHQRKTLSTNKPISVMHAVTDFMSAERFHTERIENMNQFVSKV